MNNKKGFTLIELLVVIAIIGILSGAVVVSMSGAQESAKDARIKSSLHQLRSAVELYKFTQGGEYTTAMWSDSEIAVLLGDITSQGSTTTTGLDSAAPPTKWCVSATLVGATGSWCVDGSGSNTAGTCGSTTGICTPAT